MRAHEIEELLEQVRARNDADGQNSLLQLLGLLVQQAADVAAEEHLANRSNFKTIFDVGAHIGIMTSDFRRWNPAARIFAFEPVSATFEILAQRFRDDSNVICERLALGGTAGDVLMTARPKDTFNRIIQPGTKSKVPLETVPCETGDGYCTRSGVDTIDFLKIDAEGHDFEVLKGFGRMLSEGRIQYLQVEAGMNPENTLHVNIASVLEYLQPRGYRVAAMYNQFPERNSPVLRRVDLVMVRAA